MRRGRRQARRLAFATVPSVLRTVALPATRSSRGSRAPRPFASRGACSRPSPRSGARWDRTSLARAATSHGRRTCSCSRASDRRLLSSSSCGRTSPTRSAPGPRASRDIASPAPDRPRAQLHGPRRARPRRPRSASPDKSRTDSPHSVPRSRAASPRDPAHRYHSAERPHYTPRPRTRSATRRPARSRAARPSHGPRAPPPRRSRRPATRGSVTAPATTQPPRGPHATIDRRPSLLAGCVHWPRIVRSEHARDAHR